MNANNYPIVLLIVHCIVLFGICLKYCINVYLNSWQVAKVDHSSDNTTKTTFVRDITADHKCCKIVLVQALLEGQRLR